LVLGFGLRSLVEKPTIAEKPRMTIARISISSASIMDSSTVESLGNLEERQYSGF
jgi:hypothetical protein